MPAHLRPLSAGGVSGGGGGGGGGAAGHRAWPELRPADEKVRRHRSPAAVSPPAVLAGWPTDRLTGPGRQP